MLYRLKLSYKGTNYIGWQIQEKQGRTIQGELMKALGKICKLSGEELGQIKIIGSGRTDTGVHSFGQVARIEIPLKIDPRSLRSALNSNLDFDIRILEAHDCDESFHPLRDSKSKEYWYVFANLDNAPPHARELMSNFPFEIDVELMKKGAKLFEGTHDFCNYFCTGTEVSTTVRTIYECELVHHKSSGLWNFYVPDYYVLRIKGNGFLKQMVRLIMGALWNLGRGKITLSQLEESLRQPIPKKLGMTAPPQGLYQMYVEYPSLSQGIDKN